MSAVALIGIPVGAVGLGFAVVGFGLEATIVVMGTVFRA